MLSPSFAMPEALLTFALIPCIGCVPRLVRVYTVPRVLQLWQELAQHHHLHVLRTAVEVPAYYDCYSALP